IAEVLAHRRAGIRCQKLHRRRIRSRGFDHDRVIHRAEVLQSLDHLGHRRRFLTNRNVDTDYVFALLVDDRVDGDGSLACLTIANDQLALTATDRHHRVDRFETCLQWFFHGLSIDHAWRNALNRVVVVGNDWTSVVDRIAEHVDHASDKRVAHRHFYDAPRALYEIAFADGLKVTEQHGANLVFFKVQGETANVVWKLEQFAGHDLFQSVQLGNSVTDLDDGSHFSDRHSGFEVL